MLTRRTLLGGAAALGIPSAVAPSPANARADRDGGLSPGDTLLTILHTNDLHGHAYRPGQAFGLARIAPLIRQIRAEMPNVVLLEAGDIIHGTPEEKAFAGRPLLTAMNTLGYDAATVGNHEFDFGQQRLRDVMDFARFPMLSANVADERTGKPWGGLKPYVMVERGGARIGVFGVTTPTTVGIEWPRTLSGIRFTDPHEAARRMGAHLRGTERADVVIALSHLGYLPDRSLAGAVPGIDLILGGHSHTTLAEQVWVNGALIVQTGCYGNALSRVDLVVRKATGSSEPGRVVQINGCGGHWWGKEGVSAPLGRKYPTGPLLLPTDTEDAAIVAAYRPFFTATAVSLNEVLTTAAESLPAKDAIRRETAIGNLLADAARAQAKTDVAFASSALIDPKGLAAGPVRVDDLYRLLGSYTRQHLVTVRVPGALLAETLTHLTGDPAKLPVHLSGAAVTGSGVQVGDTPLRTDQTYSVAAAAHVIQDFLYGKPNVTVVQDDVLAPTIRDAAIAYLRGHAPLHDTFSSRWQTRRNA
jgi:2',3'-cyclic-nucleotide 2'-phosphodiesterase (5'-nucleotidase family)